MQHYFHQGVSNDKKRRLSRSNFENVSVDKLIFEIVESQNPNWQLRQIRFEMDVQPVTATIDVQLVKTALSGLLINAIESTPVGGEITITSIDGPHQWEIEVADSSRSNSFFATPANNQLVDADLIDGEDEPVILTFPANEYLRKAYRAAIEHGGEIQSWECPQGGLAYLLVVPRRRYVNAA